MRILTNMSADDYSSSAFGSTRPLSCYLVIILDWRWLANFFQHNVDWGLSRNSQALFFLYHVPIMRMTVRTSTKSYGWDSKGGDL